MSGAHRQRGDVIFLSSRTRRVRIPCLHRVLLSSTVPSHRAYSNRTSDCVSCIFLVAGGVLADIACHDEPQSDLITVPGEYVDYRYSPELEPCAGNFAHVDAFAEYTTAFLGVTPDIFPHVSFSWLTNDDMQMWAPGDCGYACANGTEGFSSNPIHLHEIAHALLYGLNPKPAPFLAEGIAVALEPFEGGDYTKYPPADPREDLTRTGSFAGIYDKVGLFTLYLLQVHGPEKFRQLYQAIPAVSTNSHWDAAMREIYGLSLDSVVEAYLAATTCPENIIPLPNYECSAPVLPSQASGWKFERALNCGDDDVRGGLDSDWGFVAGVTFVVEKSGDYDVAYQGPEVSLVRLGPCDQCRWLPQEVVFHGGLTRRTHFEAGRHLLTVRVFETEPQPVEVEITPAP